MTSLFTRQQAAALYDSGFWRALGTVERATFQLAEDRLCMPFEVFHEAVEASLGRPVSAAEYVAPRRLLNELTGGHSVAPGDLLCLIPRAHRRLLAA